MKKVFFIFALMVSTVSSQAQVVTPSFTPYTFEQMVAPLEMYKRDLQQARATLDSYVEKAMDAIDRGNYERAKYYFEQCSQLNQRFKGNVCKQSDLNEWINYCNKKIKENSQQRQFSNSPSASSSMERTYKTPSVSRNYDNSTNVLYVIAKPTETILVLSCKNDLEGGWMNIDKNAYIVANGTKYFLTRTEGIAYAPNYTYFSYPGETKTFSLYFPAIPQNTTTIDFVESPSSDWRMYGILLR